MKITAYLITISLLLGLVAPCAVYGEETDEVKGQTRILKINSEGDVVLDITPDQLREAGFNVGDETRVTLDGYGFSEKMPFFITDSDSITDAMALVDDDGQLAVSVAKGCFAEKLGFKKAADGKVWTGSDGKEINPGSVTIKMSERGAYLEQYQMRNPERTYDRDDYDSDAGYANFRAITAGHIGEEVLYRSSSPINDVLNRADYAAKKMKKAGVKAVINLSDNEKNALKYIEKSGNTYYKELYDAGNVLCLNLSYDFDSEDFKQGICEAVRFIGTHEGPYLIHCTEGKDRTGFLAVVLESLMGASVAEMTMDYMKTYRNFYDFDKNSDQFKYTRKNYLGEIFSDMAGTKDRVALASTDYHKASVDFLTSGGVTQSELDAVTNALNDTEEAYEMIPGISVDGSAADANGKVDLGLQDEDFTVFSGSDIKPGRRTLIVNGVYMYNGRDYKIAYKNNKHAGQMKIIVTFKGKTDMNKDGVKKVTMSYGITPKEVRSEDVRIRMNKKGTKVKLVKDLTRQKAIPPRFYSVDMEKRQITFSGDYTGVISF